MKELKTYYRDIRKALPCGWFHSRRLMKDLRCAVSQYLQEYPNATFQDITNRFGTAQQIAEAYAEQLPPEKLRKNISIRKRALAILATSCAVAVMGWLIYLAAVTIEIHNREPYYITVEIESSKGENGK